MLTDKCPICEASHANEAFCHACGFEFNIWNNFGELQPNKTYDRMSYELQKIKSELGVAYDAGVRDTWSYTQRIKQLKFAMGTEDLA